jgi:ATP-dependent DNA helicase RecQ
MQKPEEVLKKYWNYDGFRSPQLQIIESIVNKQDTLALMPTGGGKSICFQVPAMMQEGLCVVISPLIALMKDQVFQLKKREIRAAAIFSGLSYKEIDIILDNAVFGYYKFLYVSPERLKTEIFIERFKKMPVNLIAIDEAHCISQWGYDFRPPYLEIAEIRKHHPDIPALALTASATPQVQQDIQDKLAFKHNNVFKKSFIRNNIVFVVRHEVSKLNKILEIIKKLNGSGIIYVRNRNKTKEISEFLSKNGVSADYYHAGLNNEERSRKQENWILNKTKIIVCTNAFGMGIDKPDVRFVIHADIPETLEAYYQEAGRAGRDGSKSYAIALYTETDKANLEEKVAEKFPDINQVKKIYNSIFNYFEIAQGGGKFRTYKFDIHHFAKLFNYKPALVYQALKFLEQENYIQLNETFFMPSRMMFALDKLELYKFQVAHYQYDAVIKALLRTYGGILSNFIKINENDLARMLKISVKELKTQLYFLRKNKVLFYEERTDEPEISFLEERLHQDSLTFNLKRIKERKEVAEHQLENILKYINEINICRQYIICEYFGDRILPCGRCDICLEHKHNEDKAAKISAARTDILKKITNEFVPIDYFIPDKFFQKHDYELAMRSLLDDQLMELNYKNEIRKK